LDEVKDESEKLFEVLKTEKEFKEIPGAGHLFEEGETLGELLRLTIGWYMRRLKK
jgi:hypothetical protein